MTFITIKEVGPRDGLQNEKRIISTKDKISLVNALASTGLSYIEVTSFVKEKAIPSLSDAVDVFEGITKKDGVIYGCLVPNMKGYSRAKKSGAEEISVFLSCSEIHSKKNINQTISQCLEECRRVITEAKKDNIRVRAYLSMVFGCPDEGDIAIQKVEKLCLELLDMGVYEVSLGDTVGFANPNQISTFFTTLSSEIPRNKLALHFHNTYGLALANIYESLKHGIITFDSSVGGLGGCPFANGASGNVATEDVVYMLHQLGYQTNINESAFIPISRKMEKLLQKPLFSYVYQARKNSKDK